MKTALPVVAPSRSDHRQRSAVERRVHRCGIDEGLEDRAGGTLGDRVIQLAEAIVAASDQGQHLAGVGIEGDQRHLRHGTVLDLDLGFGGLAGAGFDLLGAPLDHLLVDQLHAFVDGFGGGLLQVGVNGGVDAQGLLIQVVIAVLVGELVFHQVNEVGRVAGFIVGRRQLKWSGLGAIGLVARDGAGLHHGVEHEVAALEGTLGMPVRRKIAGTLNDSGQQGAFRQSEILYVLVEVGARAFAHTHDAETAALPERNLVGIHLEDALLGELLLQVHRDNHLGQLALYGLLGGEKESARKLHSEGRAALAAVAVHDVSHGSFDQAVVIYAAMLEEAAILDGDHSVDQVFGELVELDELALGPVRAFKERRNQHGLEFVRLQGIAFTASTAELADLAAGKLDDCRIGGVERLGSGKDFDAVADHAVVAEG